MDECTHLDHIRPVAPSGEGCQDCLAAGQHNWLHLRMCQECGHIGCCDSSPGRHATAHFHGSSHPLVQSYEPGEEWFWCFVDELGFEIGGRPPSPAHPV
jgi:hypothetical protein